MKLNFWHKHTFKGSDWVLVKDTETYSRWSEDPTIPISMAKTYSNSCLTCGDLVFRRVEL